MSHPRTPFLHEGSRTLALKFQATEYLVDVKPLLSLATSASRYAHCALSIFLGILIQQPKPRLVKVLIKSIVDWASDGINGPVLDSVVLSLWDCLFQLHYGIRNSLTRQTVQATRFPQWVQSTRDHVSQQTLLNLLEECVFGKRRWSYILLRKSFTLTPRSMQRFKL